MACRSETCCAPVSTYKSDANGRATVPGEGCPVPAVTIFPPSGSYVILPTVVALSCNVAGAVIYYTLDGAEPTEDSPVYTLPFQVSSNATTVQTRAKVAGCDLGPVSAAAYPVLVGSNWQFGYLCASGDEAGVFGEFAANGQANDYQFVLTFTLGADTEIRDITVLETDATGFWNSGQSWSTKEWIYPFPDPSIPFHTYPLVLIDQAGPTKLFTSYESTLGTVVAGTYEWRMWGQPFRALSGYFLCRITLGDGTVIQRLIDTICTPPPPPCPPLAPPTLTAFCTPTVQLDGTYAVPVRVWKRSLDCGDGTWTWLTTKPAGTWVYHDSPFVTRCCTYEYYVDYLCGGNYIASAVAAILVPCDCIIGLSPDATKVCAGAPVVISFDSLQCLGEISWGTGGEFGSFTGTGVLNGTITVNPAATTTYTFKGTSVSCGDYFSEVTITVETCGCWTDLGCACLAVPDSVIVTFNDSTGAPRAVLLVNRGSYQTLADTPCVGCGGKYYTATINYSLVNDGDAQWPNRLEMLPVYLGVNLCEASHPSAPTAAWVVTMPVGFTSWAAALYSQTTLTGNYTVVYNPLLASNVVVT